MIKSGQVQLSRRFFSATLLAAGDHQRARLCRGGTIAHDRTDIGETAHRLTPDLAIFPDGAVAMRFTPCLGDDIAADLSARQAIGDAIALAGGNDESGPITDERA